MSSCSPSFITHYSLLGRSAAPCPEPALSAAKGASVVKNEPRPALTPTPSDSRVRPRARPGPRPRPERVVPDEPPDRGLAHARVAGGEEVGEPALRAPPRA